RTTPRRAASHKRMAAAEAPLACDPRRGGCSSGNEVERNLAGGDPPDVLGNKPGTRLEHAVGPPGDVRRHQHVRQLVKRAGGGGGSARLAWVPVPYIERRAGDASSGQRDIERILIDDI